MRALTPATDEFTELTSALGRYLRYYGPRTVSMQVNRVMREYKKVEQARRRYLQAEASYERARQRFSELAG